MADEQLRELERLAHSEGGLEAKVELLRYRLRQGDLSPEWLATAAHLGDKAARNTLGRFVPVATYATILRSLANDEWPKELALRAGVAWLEPTATGKLERAALAVLAYAESPGPAQFAACEELRPGARDPASTLLDAVLLPEGGAAQRQLRAILPPVRPGVAAPSDQVRELREALQPYALLSCGSPPPGLLPPDPAAWESFGVAPAPREDLFREFRRALKSPAVASKREALQAALEAETLSQDRLELAALLGSPAAWLLTEPEGSPDLNPPARGALMAGSLLAGVARVSGGHHRDALVREHLLRNLRHAPDDRTLGEGLRFPHWWRALYLRLALALAERLAEECPRDEDPKPQRAVEVARDFARGEAEADEVRLAASAIAQLARAEALSGAARAAARPLAACLRLAVVLLTSAERPTFSLGVTLPEAERASARREDVLELALYPGGPLPEELWGLLREEAIEWLLDPSASDLAAQRPYDPEHHYALGDFVVHATFGSGEVREVRRDRIDVNFADQARTLVHRPL